ncbi:MAG: cobalamin biosynthesis protein, partial [bacterium]|nr:cobalamin biosynthesis protein [bacterium]
MKLAAKLWIGIVVLIVLSPLGLLLPEHFKAGNAWGEWGVDEMRKLVGYIPRGLAKLSGLWQAP